MNDDGNNMQIPEKIGLCLSGGGYRAAGYHLGTLDYLDQLKGLYPDKSETMLSKVTMLSTVSGGTFIGAAYAARLAEDVSFHEFFENAFFELREGKYIQGLLNNMVEGKKRRNLIKAAAEMYSTTFLADNNQKPYRFGKILDADMPLHTIIFNATCFYTGMNFRFQKSKTDSFGTHYTTIKQEDKRKIRLGDIAAASSCFPAGFEPLAFPDDFDWDGGDPPELIWQPTEKNPPKSIALMDGGVADNVGLNSLRQTPEHHELDLIIASDVDAKPIDLYKDFPLKLHTRNFFQKESRISLKVRYLDWIIKGIIIVAILAAIGLGVFCYEYFNAAGFSLKTLIQYGIAMWLSLTVAVGLWFTRRLFKGTVLKYFDDLLALRENLYKDSGETHLAESDLTHSWDIFKQLSLGQAINMVKLRISSVYAMTNSVFMRCIRKLTYDISYGNERYQKKLVSSLIYDLAESHYDPYFGKVQRNDIGDCPPDKRFPPPSEKLLEVVNGIKNMSSTLWWENECQLPMLVGCGQATICFKLLKHIIDNSDLDENCLPINNDIQPLFNRLADDWDRLVQDPYAILRDRYSDLVQEYFKYPDECEEKVEPAA